MTFSYTQNIPYNVDVFPSYTSSTLPGFGGNGSNPYFPSDGGFSYSDVPNYNPFEDSDVDPPSFGDLPNMFDQDDNDNPLQNILDFVNSDEVKGIAKNIRDLFYSGDGVRYPGFDNALSEETVQRINFDTEARLSDLRGVLNDIAYLTGKSTPEFVSETERRFTGTFDPMALRGHTYLTKEPEKFGEKISQSSQQAKKNIDDYLEQYSNLNRETFMSQATNPTTVSIDPSIYDEQINKYMDQANMSKMYDYGDPQSQEFISGAGSPDSKYDRKRMAGFYASDPGVQQLMSYSSYS
tara:strand:- start:8507 stop:9391 length:885 start_codon:yes stop_codon:yes gene_type:complete